MTCMTSARLLWFASLFSVAAQAQVGHSFTYQGRLDDGGSPKTGTVDLRFDAFGVPTAGSALNPAPAILDGVALNEGVFSVVVDLGASVFLGTPVFLQIGVREDAAGAPGDPNGFTTLAPRQRVTPAPYAIHAENISLDAIGTEQVLDGTLNASDVNTTSTSIGLQRRLTAACPAGQVLSNIASNGVPTCVLGGDITAVFTAAGSGLSGGGASGDASLSINLGETQARVSGKCEPGRAVIGAINSNGSVDCVYVDTPTPIAPVILDAAGDVGSHLSVRQEAVSGVLPGVAYYDATNKRLKYVHCDTNSCGAIETPRILDDPVNDVGQFPSVKFVPPNLAVAYYDASAGDLKLALCSTFNCSGGTVTLRTLDTAGNVGRHAAIMNVNNRVAVAYFDATANNYKYVRCSDAACTAPVVRTLAGLGGGGLASSAVASVRNQDLTLPEFTVLKDGSEVVLVRCTDVDCIAFTTVPISTSTDVGPPLTMLRTTIASTVQRWFGFARPLSGFAAHRTCSGDACTVTVGVAGSNLANPAGSVFLQRDNLSPMYFQTRSAETEIRALPFLGPDRVADANGLTGSNTAQAAIDAFMVAFAGPGLVYYEAGAQNLVYLRCSREDCTEL